MDAQKRHGAWLLGAPARVYGWGVAAGPLGRTRVLGQREGKWTSEVCCWLHGPSGMKGGASWATREDKVKAQVAIGLGGKG